MFYYLFFFFRFSRKKPRRKAFHSNTKCPHPTQQYQTLLSDIEPRGIATSQNILYFVKNPGEFFKKHQTTRFIIDEPGPSELTTQAPRNQTRHGVLKHPPVGSPVMVVPKMMNILYIVGGQN